MKTVTCHKCNIAKPAHEFPRNPTMVNKHSNTCKLCVSIHRKQIHRTKKGLASAIYNKQRSTSKKRNHTLPAYTKADLTAWLTQQQLFHDLHAAWIKADYVNTLTPSCDRIDDYAPYTLNNIKLGTWQDNLHNYHTACKSGINSKALTPVSKHDLNGHWLQTYYSIAEAARQNNCHDTNIVQVCRGRTNTCAGYIWKYA